MPPDAGRGGRLLLTLAVVLWAVALGVIGVRAATAGGHHSVYPIFAGAGRDWLAGRDLYEYRPAEQSGPYRYSPAVAALLAPLSLLPDAIGGVAWRLGCAAVLLGGLAWWSRALLPDAAASWRGGLFLLVLPLALGNLNNGQSNALVLGLILTATAALADHSESRGRWAEVLAGSALSGAVLLKGYPVAAVLLLAVAAPRRRFMVWFVAALAAGLLLPFLLQRPEYVTGQYGRWWEHLSTSDRANLPRLVWYRDVRLLLANLGLPLPNALYPAVQLLAGAAMAGVCQWQRMAGRPATSRLTLAAGLGFCWMTALGPAAESATYVLLAPTAAGSLLTAWRLGRSWPLRGVLLLGYLLLLASQAAAWLPSAKELHALGVQPLAGLLVLAGLTAALVPRPAGDDAAGRRGLQYTQEIST